MYDIYTDFQQFWQLSLIKLQHVQLYMVCSITPNSVEQHEIF